MHVIELKRTTHTCSSDKTTTSPLHRERNSVAVMHLILAS